MKFLVHSNFELADKIWKIIEDRVGDSLVVGLIGDLGAGKTTLVKEIAKKLGIRQLVSSPTFNIAKLYRIESDRGLRALYHVDLYRLNKPTKTDLMEIIEQISNKKTLTFIEWIDNSLELFEKADLIIKFKFLSETAREVEVEWK
jgi:tRNA threonylcarbamoyladenosine biosynthesis protein TsaE